MPTLSLEELRRLVDIMKKMHHEAACENWQELSRLDSERRAVLKYDPTAELAAPQHPLETQTKVAAMPDNIQTSENTDLRQLSQLTEEILSLDRVIISTVQQARQKLLGENRELSAQLKAQKLYALTSSMS